MARADDIEGQQSGGGEPDAAPSGPSVPAWKEEALAAIAKLRHAAVLNPDDVDRWLDAMHEREPQRILWHIRRNDGVSASSVQTHIDEMEGLYPRFETARELDMQRLFRLTPQVPNHHMIRGTLLENVNRQVFHTMYNLRTAEAELARIAGQRGIRQAPSLVGNPDDLVAARSGPSALILPDYKVPAKRKELDVDVFPHYVAQLHQYALLANAAGVKVQKMVLSNLYLEANFAKDLVDAIAAAPEGSQERADIETEAADRIVWTLRRFADPKSVDFTPIEIPLDIGIATKIVKAANLADDRVQRGVPAPWPKREPLPVKPETVQNLQSYAETYLRLNQLSVQSSALAGKVLEEIRGHLKVDLGDRPVEKKKTPFPGLSVFTQSQLDAEAAVEMLRAAGEPVDDLLERKFDPKRAHQVALALGAEPADLLGPPTVRSDAKDTIRKRLDAIGVPAGRFENFPLVIKQSGAKTGPGAERIAIARHAAYQTLEEVLTAAGVQPDASVEEILTERPTNEDAPPMSDDAHDSPSPG